MKFPYAVKHNGVNYKPFEEIDMGEKSPMSKPLEEKVEEDSVVAKKTRKSKDKE